LTIGVFDNEGGSRHRNTKRNTAEQSIE